MLEIRLVESFILKNFGILKLFVLEKLDYILSYTVTVTKDRFSETSQAILATEQLKK